MTSDHPSVRAYAEHVNPAFVKLLGVLGYGRLFTKARDVWIWDDAGRVYLDLLAGFGAVNVGHNHPRLAARMASFAAEKVPNLIHVGPSEAEAKLAAELSALTGDRLPRVLFSSTGAEAVEASMKLARAATGRSATVSCEGGFHGTSFGALSIMGPARMRKPFEPLLPECRRIPFGDAAALERALAPKDVAAFVVEPIQGEAGVVLPRSDYLPAAASICRAHGTLLVLDEVQTGLARTGKLFAYQHSPMDAPDVLVLGKSLGGSIAPLSATLTTREIHDAAYGSMNRFDLHGATFSGNAFACAMGSETLGILRHGHLAERSTARGGQLLEALRAGLTGHPLVRDVRGQGLMIAIDLGPTPATLLGRTLPIVVEMISRQIFGQWIAVSLLERGILCQPASQQWNVLKLTPPLTIGEPQIAHAAKTIVALLQDYRTLPPLLKDTVERLGRQALGGLRF
ncbi:MAG: aspartate aminotransferase family protein [Acidobacteriota bacterium]